MCSLPATTATSRKSITTPINISTMANKQNIHVGEKVEEKEEEEEEKRSKK